MREPSSELRVRHAAGVEGLRLLQKMTEEELIPVTLMGIRGRNPSAVTATSRRRVEPAAEPRGNTP